MAHGVFDIFNFSNTFTDNKRKRAIYNLKAINAKYSCVIFSKED